MPSKLSKTEEIHMPYLNWNRLKQYSNTTITIPYAIKVEKYSLPNVYTYKILQVEYKIDGKDTNNHYFLLTTLFK